jgi:regulator of RNase E activity RraA
MSGQLDTLPWGEDPLDSSITVSMLSDSLDRAGLRSQVLASRLQPLVPLTRATGRARTALFVPDDTIDPERPYDDAIDFIDGSQPGDFIVVSTSESNASRMETSGTRTKLWHCVSRYSPPAGAP